MLNKDRKRGLTIALRIAEENMQNIEQIVNMEAHKGILYDTKCNITSETKEEILKRVSLVKDRIKRLKRYGDVQDGLDNILDPQLNRITDLILEMEHLLGSISK